MTLEEFIAEAHKQVEAFKAMWIAESAKGEMIDVDLIYPTEMDASEWDEQFRAWGGFVMIPVGHVAWVTAEYGMAKVLNLSKTKLGLFVYHLLRLGGTIRSTHVLNHRYDRSYVQTAVTLPKGKMEELQNLTGVELEVPTRVVLA